MEFVFSHDGKTLKNIKDCHKKRIVIPQGVEIIGGRAFEHKNNPQEIIIPNTITEIEAEAFYNSSLKKICFTDSVKHIDHGAFMHCKALMSIKLPSGLTVVTYEILAYCTSIQQIDIPKGVIEIEYSAFRNCCSLKHIQIPNNVEHIGESAFSGCTNLQSIIIPEKITIVERETFYGCTSLKKVQLPSNVTEIRECAFSTCQSLTDICLPEGLKKLRNRALGFTNLKRIVIPSTIEYISDFAFHGCRELEEIELSGDNPYYTVNDGVLYDKACTKLIKFPPAKKVKTFTTPKSVKEIGNTAFSFCRHLEEVVITDNVSKVNLGAFYGCNNLKKVLFEGTLDSVEKQAFEGCVSLQSIDLPEGLTSIDSRGFYGCTSLKNIRLPYSLEKIGKEAFGHCEALTAILLPADLQCIEYDTFVGCNSLQRIDVDENNNVYSSLDGVLYNKEMSKLLVYPKDKRTSHYVFPDSVCSIDYDVWKNCKWLKRIEIPSFLSPFPTFEGCTSLEHVTIIGRRRIGYNYFKGCTSLKELHLRVDDIYGVKVNNDAFEEVVYERCKLFVYAEHMQDVRYYPNLGRFKYIREEKR